MQQLNQDLRDHSYHQIYLLYGEEDFLKKSYKNRLIEALTGGDEMNFSSFVGKEADFVKFHDIAETLPFFAERRCILLEDTGLFKASSEEWADYAAKLPETTYLIFVEKEVDKRNRLYKAVLKSGYPCELARQSEEDLKRWILGILKKENKKITREALELFCARCGDNMDLIYRELMKLVSYIGEEEGILPGHVDEIVTVRTENRIFDMVDAVSKGNTEKALDLYYDLLALKEPSMRILFLIARQFNQLMQVKEMHANRVPQDQMASAMGVRPFVLNRLSAVSRNFNREQLRRAVEICVEAEEAIKTGKMTDQIALELAMIELAGLAKRSS